ncbi:PLC-like phosphodiesterase [Neurospora tetraspora]|uniref:glycerophosphodiester phosphodiesterase n=1 Tax=Neurospora tetraspora TaxID=94610 RepID=A0AAE0MNW7_9PEZI|nr:PLC-like phosphodiesterase [Neurospora tetraspora]
MPSTLSTLCLVALAAPALALPSHGGPGKDQSGIKPIKRIQLGPRPYWLIDQMEDSPLKTKLQSCSEKEMRPSRWSIGHRGGGTLQFPEETEASIMAGTRMGAGIEECDVTFTSDQQLICRHSQCDLHTTTNILTIPSLAAKCTVPFTPYNATTKQSATAKCCTSDFTLAELTETKGLCSKMDSSNPQATTPEEYQGGVPGYRTTLYSGPGTCHKLLTVKEYIALVDTLGLDFTPELKTPEVKMPFGSANFTQEAFAQQLIDEFKEAEINPKRVWLQSFLYDDVLYWLRAEPEFAKQAILLDQSGDAPSTISAATASLTKYAQDGVQIVAPPLEYLVSTATDKDGKVKVVASEYAKQAKKLGLKVISWSLERSGWLADSTKGGYYYSTIANATAARGEGVVFELLDVLASKEVGAIAVFSDWSATVSYYANCFGLFP